jgi:SAM-dependent methyltransferase
LEQDLFALLVCPVTGQPLRRVGDALVTPDGQRRYPVVRGVPRFVPSDHYVRSFSYEWNLHKRTQLDTYRADTSSEEMFRRKTGLTPEQVRGKLVLDAGVGAGRFTDVLVKWGARVVGVDLSYAVEAAQENFGRSPQVLICQADIAHLPFAEGTFDYIVSIGVLHHTPDTRRFFSCLPRLLRPGGEIAVWVYPDEGDYVTRAAWIPFTSRIPHRMFYRFCKVLVNWAARHRDSQGAYFLRRVFPISDQGLGLANDILDTFDGYSPRYHGIHSPAEVEGWFREQGLRDIRRLDWNTAVRGRR